MKYTKKQISEIIDSNGDLIGANSVPTNGSDLESQADNTTDYNKKVATQPYSLSTLGKFGFTLLPFYEGKENKNQIELMDDLSKYLLERYVDILEYYYKNPNKLKSDYRKLKDNQEIDNKFGSETAIKIIKLIQPHFEKSINSLENIDESKVVEDKMLNTKKENEISVKRDNNDLKEKKIEKIAGLIGKLKKTDIDKLINLLERK